MGETVDVLVVGTSSPCYILAGKLMVLCNMQLAIMVLAGAREVFPHWFVRCVKTGVRRTARKTMNPGQ